MDLTLSHCFIQVLDQDEALAFYRDVRIDAQLESFRWLTVGPSSQPYRVRDCAFRDPSGNMVCFSGRPKS